MFDLWRRYCNKAFRLIALAAARCMAGAENYLPAGALLT